MSGNTPPINRLPPETLIEIFSLVQTRGVELVRKEPYPWKLSLVCRFWRDITFNAPQLWATIHIHLDPVQTSRTTTRHKALMTAWNVCLERSREYPLVFSIQANTTQTLAFIPSFMSQCVHHVGHWGTVVFDTPIEDILPFISDPNLQYPHLRSLTLRGTPASFGGDSGVPKTVLFQEAPLLSKLILQEFPYRLVKLGLPWSQITDFSADVNADEISDLLDVLRAMPNLISLRFHKYHSEEQNVQVTRILELIHLRKLSWLTYMVNHSLFFNSLHAPRLEELVFQCTDRNWDNSFQQFLCRSRCMINSIRLEKVSAALAISLLALLPEVETATFSNLSSTKELIRDLTFEDSKPRWVGPNIKRIVFEDMRTLGIEELASMVESRLCIPSNPSTRGRRLESLHIVVHKYYEVPVQPHPFYSNVFQPLEQRFSPQGMMSITYEEKSPFE